MSGSPAAGSRSLSCRATRAPAKATPASRISPARSTRTCNLAIDGQAAFEINTGPFGEISVVMAGTPEAMEMTLQGGGTPSGPITYAFTLTAE